ncbi:hypothetical protein [Mesorhizobium sp. M0965]|uniref:hypothetical protein n=1 Tax=Mesorhizobium sp. M0965 TaxID=2957036 RepID=UPI00333740B5
MLSPWRPNSSFATYANGRILAVKALADNTVAATLNVIGIGAKSIRKMLSAGESALPGPSCRQAAGLRPLLAHGCWWADYHKECVIMAADFRRQVSQERAHDYQRGDV